MIARTWRGTTRAVDGDEYAAYIDATGMRAYASTPGNLGAFLLRKSVDHADGAETEFLVVSLWESMEAVKRFAGEDPTRAVFYPEDDRYLVRRDLTVDHYDVVARHQVPAAAASRL